MIEHSTGIRKLIEKRLGQGKLGYMSVLRTLKGADPREVWDVYRKYMPKAEKDIPKKPGLYSSHRGFPEPHPAYSQWRLDDVSTDFILHEIEENKYGSIAFLGCPVLASEFNYGSKAERLALDIDSSSLGVLRRWEVNAQKYDVNDELPKELIGKFDCAVSDPPWYHDDIQRFVARGCQLVREGGTVYFSMPRMLTKPSIPAERLDFQTWLSKCGLVIDQMSERAVYEVPPFEYRAYFDIPCFTGEPWRTGDWVELKKVDTRKIKMPAKREEPNWLEWNISGKRVLLREKKDDGKRARLSSLYENGSLILNSVSKRNPLVEKVDVWTSRNAVLHIDSGSGEVKAVLENIAGGSRVVYSDSRAEIAELLRKLIQI